MNGAGAGADLIEGKSAANAELDITVATAVTHRILCFIILSSRENHYIIIAIS
jgi:hypothetical protein